MKRGLPVIFTLLLVNFLSPHEIQASTRIQDAKRPNIIFIMVDDMGRDWISCYGQQPNTETPNIDRLAKEGLRYETAWCNPICTPTRVDATHRPVRLSTRLDPSLRRRAQGR